MRPTAHLVRARYIDCPDEAEGDICAVLEEGGSVSTVGPWGVHAIVSALQSVPVTTRVKSEQMGELMGLRFEVVVSGPPHGSAPADLRVAAHTSARSISTALLLGIGQSSGAVDLSIVGHKAMSRAIWGIAMATTTKPLAFVCLRNGTVRGQPCHTLRVTCLSDYSDRVHHAAAMNIMRRTANVAHQKFVASLLATCLGPSDTRRVACICAQINQERDVAVLRHAWVELLSKLDDEKITSVYHDRLHELDEPTI